MGMKIGTGSTISFSSGFFAQITAMNWSGLQREAVESTHMGTAGGARTFVPANLYDPGELEIECFLEAEKTPPITGAAETITVTMPSDGAGGNSTWQASGFLTEFEFEDPLEDRMTATGTIKFSGAITVTP